MSSRLDPSLRNLQKAYKNGSLSPVTVTKASLSRIAALQDTLNAFCYVDEKAALAAARRAAMRWQKGCPLGPLDGVPASIKDTLHVQGWPTRFGSKSTSAKPQKQDAPAVARLRAAGVILLGKTTTPEYGHKGVTDSPLTGVTRNPWHAQKTCGGSSGGAAAATAAHLAHFSLGSDAGGSVRIPASFCGVFAFKPSNGLVPAAPASFFSTLSSVGVLTRSADDAAFVLDAITQYDPRDSHALPLPPFGFAKQVRRKMPGLGSTGQKTAGQIKAGQGKVGEKAARLNIAYVTQLNDIRAMPDVEAVMHGARCHLKQLGRVTDIKIKLPALIPSFNGHWMAAAHLIVAALSPTKKKMVDARLRHWAARGAKQKRDDYIQAQQQRVEIAEYFTNLFTRYDLIVTPTTAMTAFDLGSNMPKDLRGRDWPDWTPFTYIANLARLPAASLPAGLTAEGLPVGLQVMGGFLQDITVLQAAHQLESMIGFEGLRS